MGVRLVWDEDADEKILGAWDGYAGDDLGPQIAARAVRFCPEDTGDLAESVEDHLNGHTLVIAATGSDRRWYAAFVELGHRVFHPSTRIVGPEVVPPQPFLRPAVFGGIAPGTRRTSREDMVWQWSHGMGAHLQTKQQGYSYVGRLGDMYVYERNGQRVYSMEPPRSGGPSGGLVRHASSVHDSYRRRVLREHGIDIDDPGDMRVPF